MSRLWQINIDSDYFWNQVRPAAVSGGAEYIYLLSYAALHMEYGGSQNACLCASLEVTFPFPSVFPSLVKLNVFAC